MPQRAERRPPARDGKSQHRASWREIDRAWLWRGLLAVAVIALVLLIAKAAMMAFGGATRRDIGTVNEYRHSLLVPIELVPRLTRPAPTGRVKRE